MRQRETGQHQATAVRLSEMLRMDRAQVKQAGRRRNRVFAHDRYVTILNEGTEAI